LNPSQIDGKIQTNTVKVRRLSWSSSFEPLLAKLPYLSLEFKDSFIFHSIKTQEVERIVREKKFEGLE